jgi:hypothetical protein
MFIHFRYTILAAVLSALSCAPGECGDYCDLHDLDPTLCACVAGHPDPGYGPSGYCAQHEPGTVERLGCDAEGAAAHSCQTPATGIELGDLRVSCCAD